MKHEPTLLTRKQASEIMGVKPDTLRKWSKVNILKPYCRVNGRPRYRLEDLNNLLKPSTPTNGK